MPILTLEQAKEMLQITDSSKDSVINSLIAPIEAFVKGYTKNDFVFNEEEVFPEDLQIIAVQIIGRFLNKKNWQGISSEQIAGYSVSIMDDLPGWIYKILNSYRRLKFC